MSDAVETATAAITGVTATNPAYNLNVPPRELEKIAIFETSDKGLFEISNKVAKVASKIRNVAHLAYCIGEAITNPDMLLNILGNIAKNLAETAMDMAKRLFACVGEQIMNTIGKTILNVLDSVVDFLNAVRRLLDIIDQVIKNLLDGGRILFQKFAAQEDCEYMLASMAMCLLNKLIGTKLQTFEEKVTNKIKRTGVDDRGAVTGVLADANNVASFVRHQTYHANKASAQLSMFCF